MKKICTYLDLLGFSNYMALNFNDAIKLINDYDGVLHIGLTLGNKYKSFNDFLPFSDSIFILSEDADSYIEALLSG